MTYPIGSNRSSDYLQSQGPQGAPDFKFQGKPSPDDIKRIHDAENDIESVIEKISTGQYSPDFLKKILIGGLGEPPRNNIISLILLAKRFEKNPEIAQKIGDVNTKLAEIMASEFKNPEEIKKQLQEINNVLKEIIP